MQEDEHCFPNVNLEHAMEYKNVTIDLFTATLSFSLQSVKDPYGLFIKKSSTEQKIELCRKVKLDHSVFEHIVVYCAVPHE